jgi:thiol-disulfide isomerase/thioredoxin
MECEEALAVSDPKQQTRRGFLGTAAAALAVANLPGALASPALAQGISRPAPQWEILEWINGDGGNVDTLKGKVIVIDFFQLWCPGCNKFSGPLMQYWQQKFAADIAAGRLVMVKIHTVFEGRNYQTVKRLKRYVKDKGITIPVGVDRHIARRRLPETMRRYNTKGTPEMAIIDKDGMIRFQQFGYFKPETVEPMLVRMLEQTRA